MHELPIVREIREIVLRHAQAAGAGRVLTVNLEVGALTDLQDEWVRRYFDHLSRGTVAEGAAVRIDRIPGIFSCSDCGGSFEVHSLLEEDLSCPECHNEAVTVVSGRAYRVKNIEVL